MDAKFRSRRYRLAMGTIAIAGTALLGGVVALMLGRTIDGLAAAIAAFTGCGALVLGGYGFTRSKWGAADADSDKG